MGTRQRRCPGTERGRCLCARTPGGCADTRRAQGGGRTPGTPAAAAVRLFPRDQWCPSGYASTPRPARVLLDPRLTYFSWWQKWLSALPPPCTRGMCKRDRCRLTATRAAVRLCGPRGKAGPWAGSLGSSHSLTRAGRPQSGRQEAAPWCPADLEPWSLGLRSPSPWGGGGPPSPRPGAHAECRGGVPTCTALLCASVGREPQTRGRGIEGGRRGGAGPSGRTPGGRGPARATGRGGHEGLERTVRRSALGGCGSRGRDWTGREAGLVLRLCYWGGRRPCRGSLPARTPASSPAVGRGDGPASGSPPGPVGRCQGRAPPGGRVCGLGSVRGASR